MAAAKQKSVLEPEAPAVEAPKTPVQIQAQIDKLKADHQAAAVAAEEAHRTALGDLVLAHRAASEAAERQVDFRVRDRLETAMEKLNSPDDAAKAAERAEQEAEQEKLRARVAGPLARAKEIKNQLIAFSQEYESRFRQLQTMSRETFYAGLPSVGGAGLTSVGLVTRLQRNVDACLTLLDTTKKNIEDQSREIEGLVSTGWMRLRKDQLDRALVQELHELRLSASDDVLWQLNTYAKSIASCVEAIAALRAKYAGTAEATEPMQFENKGAVVEGLKTAKRMTEGLPSHADISYSPFGGR